MLRATFNFVLNLRMATIVCLSVCLEWKQEHATVCQVSCCKTIVGVFGLTWLTCLCLLWNGQPLVVEVQSQCKYTVYFLNDSPHTSLIYEGATTHGDRGLLQCDFYHVRSFMTGWLLWILLWTPVDPCSVGGIPVTTLTCAESDPACPLTFSLHRFHMLKF